MEVQIPEMVKDYSFKKVGVDVGDQKLISKLSYEDTIRCKGWSRKVMRMERMIQLQV